MSLLRSIPWPWLVPVAVFGVAVLRVQGLARLAPAGLGDEPARARVAALVRAREPELRRRALEHFTGDRWSQGDDFSNSERRLVRELSQREHMRISAVLDAIDHDVRENPAHDASFQTLRSSVTACMPRPFYD